ncbi:uncharacterized protein [Euphorbia lathyris]|uniref:uncharacterized protein n=1 Tax=Euphorbia lathyris TaxID=212925 RepID=UPI003313EB1A
MQSRRHEDYGSISPSSKPRNQHRHDVDSFHMSRRETVDRSPSMQRRSLSPNKKNDGSRRILLRDGRSGSTERRDYSWHLGSGRIEKFRSGSPPFVPEHRKPHFDEDVVHRKYEHTDELVYGDGKSGRLNHVYEYDHHPTSSRMTKEKNYTENRILGIEEGVTMGQKSMPREDGIVRGSHRVPLDYIPTSNYEKTGRKHQQLPSRHLDIGQYDNEELRYPDPISPDNLPVNELYKEGEKPMFRSRIDSYDTKPTSHLKGYGRTHFKDFAGTSSGISRSEFLSSYREGMPVCIADEYPRNGMKLTEPMDFNTFGQRSFVETRRNIETGKRVLTSYPRCSYSPNRSDHDDYVYPKSQGLVIDNNEYPSDEFRMMPPLSRLDHEQALAEYDYRELSKMSAMYPTMEKIDPTEDSYGNMRNSSTWDHNIHKQMGIENIDSRRTLYAPKHGEEYFGSEYTRHEFGRRTPRDNGTSNLNATKDQQISHLKSDYGFGRDAGPQFQKERLQDPGMSVYDLEMPKISSKRHRMEGDLAMYEPSDKLLKRMYRMEDNMNRRDPRTVIVSNKNYAQQEYEDGRESGEKWIDEDLNDLRPSMNQRFDHTVYRKAKRTYDGQGYHGDFTSEDWSSQESLGHSRKNQVRYYKPGVKYMKSHQRSGPMYWYNSNQNDKRSGIYRKNKTGKKNDENDEDEEAKGGGPLEDWVSVTNSEPCEDSEEFKQLVHEAFLDFSKKLNLSSAVRRRYQEQGKVGSLFCIVCGRSASKDFMDTQRLVTHAYMSHKVGLRAQHMGLHKAICVLMGWNTYVPCDTTTWVPDVLPDSEAWAQKEDLMLWPPLIVIHNISMSNNNPEQQQVIPIEGVEAFLRGKGFFVGGKIKVCLGKPADQSVILVKFLGTFTGLGQAEKLNKYFVENKRGREEFKEKSSSSSSSNLEGIEGEKIEEQLLYGYMGIADDLDKMDFNTKKWITVKSKKDIQDLADAPVKTDQR